MQPNQFQINEKFFRDSVSRTDLRGLGAVQQSINGGYCSLTPRNWWCVSVGPIQFAGPDYYTARRLFYAAIRQWPGRTIDLECNAGVAWHYEGR